MKKSKIVLATFGGLVLLLAAVAVSVTFIFDPNEYKPQLQTAASEALGMQVSVKGDLGIRFFPELQFTAKGVEVRKQEKELVAIKEIRVGMELMPLLQEQYNITTVLLMSPKVSLGPDDFVSEEQEAETEMPAIELSQLSISDGAFSYVGKKAGDKFSAKDCNINLNDLQLSTGDVDLIKKLSLTAGLHCGNVKAKDIVVSNMKFSLNAKSGIFDLKPISLGIFGGEGSGEVSADYSGATPKYKVNFALPNFLMEKLLKAVSSEVILAGPMSFSMNLALQGETAQQIERSVSGDVILNGKDLKLQGYDLDTVFSRFESSQSFNLLDMGALLIAGPAGVAVTKGSDFAGILTGAEGETGINILVARWKVRQGVMHSSDVAMATAKHRIALLGALDIVGGRFVDMVVALLNNKGCAQVQQKFNGPFAKPEVQQPSTAKAVAAPVLNIFKKGKEILAGDDCKVIYSGKVAVPAVGSK